MMSLARKFNLKMCWWAYGYGSLEELKEHDFIIDKPLELLSIINKLQSKSSAILFIFLYKDKIFFYNYKFTLQASDIVSQFATSKATLRLGCFFYGRIAKPSSNPFKTKLYIADILSLVLP